jgi:hypothetical protein
MVHELVRVRRRDHPVGDRRKPRHVPRLRRALRRGLRVPLLRLRSSETAPKATSVDPVATEALRSARRHEAWINVRPGMDPMRKRLKDLAPQVQEHERLQKALAALNKPTGRKSSPRQTRGGASRARRSSSRRAGRGERRQQLLRVKPSLEYGQARRRARWDQSVAARRRFSARRSDRSAPRRVWCGARGIWRRRGDGSSIRGPRMTRSRR